MISLEEKMITNVLKKLRLPCFCLMIVSLNPAYAYDSTVYCEELSAGETEAENGSYQYTSDGYYFTCSYTPVQKENIKPGDTESIYLACGEKGSANWVPEKIEVDCNSGISCSLANGMQDGRSYGVKFNCTNWDVKTKEFKVKKIECPITSNDAALMVAEVNVDGGCSTGTA